MTPDGSDWVSRRVRWAMAALAASAMLCAAQMNVAEISGTVTDPSGHAVHACVITATNSSTGLKYRAETNTAGVYLISQLPPGTYSLTATSAGFKQMVHDNVALNAGQRIALPFSLALGGRSDVVTVQAGSGVLQTESAELKDVIENQQVVALPVKDRQFLELALLSSGVVNPPGGTRGDSLQQTGKLINILGQRTGHNLFLVDGVSVTDEYYNNVALNPSPDATREFNIAKTGYDAEFGGKSGGVINVITQAGTNQFHGSAYEFLRNNAVDARNFFSPPGQTTPFHENQFGGAIGGPIVRDRSFFFVNYDGQRMDESLAQRFSVPTVAQRSGVFTTAIINPATSLPFPNNTINVPLDPAAVALLSKVPLPNQPGAANNLLALANQTGNNNAVDTRLDHQFSSSDSAFVRGSAFSAREVDPFGSSVLNEALLPGFGRDLTTRSVNISAGETHTLSPRALNEFRFGYLRVSGGQADPNAGIPFAARYGLLGTTSNPADMGYPQVSLSNTFSALGSPTGFTRRIDTDFEVFDNVNIQRGAHTIKFGGYFFHLDFNPSYPNDARGAYTFSGAYSGNALADFLLGYPSQAQAGIGEGAENAHTDWVHFYVEDGWQATRSLKLDAGLRYEFNQNLYAASNQTSDIDLSAPGGPAFVIAGNPANLPPAAAAVAAVSPIPIVPASSVGWNNSLLVPKNLRLSPRIGLAWRLPRLRDTVFRSGFGIYTNQAAYSVLQNLAENEPFFLVETVTNPARPLYTTENILTANPTGTVGANSVNHGFAIEYNEVWNATVQKQLGGDTFLETGYVGSRTVHADSATVLNVPSTLGGPRPFPELAPFSTIRWDGWASFHALTLRATRRFKHGLSFDAGYTWSKSMDDASDTGTTNAEYNLPQDPFAMNLDKGLSSFDHRHRFTANAVYALPSGRIRPGAWKRILSGWQASGLLTLQSGAPFTVNLSSAAAQNVSPIGLVSGNNLERPDLLSDPNSGPRTPAEWFNTAAFAIPAPGAFGTSGRNVAAGPGLETLDLSLQKTEPLSERLKLQLRIDAYNSLNHANFNLPGRIFGAANFGVITSAGDPRELQGAIKLMF